MYDNAWTWFIHTMCDIHTMNVHIDIVYSCNEYSYMNIRTMLFIHTMCDIHTMNVHIDLVYSYNEYTYMNIRTMYDNA